MLPPHPSRAYVCTCVPSLLKQWGNLYISKSSGHFSVPIFLDLLAELITPFLHLVLRHPALLVFLIPQWLFLLYLHSGSSLSFKPLNVDTSRAKFSDLFSLALLHPSPGDLIQSHAFKYLLCTYDIWIYVSSPWSLSWPSDSYLTVLLTSALEYVTQT